MRGFAGIVIGIIVGIAGISLVGFVGSLLFPIAIDPAIRNPIEQAAASILAASLPAKLMIALSWLVSGIVGGAAAKAISGRATILWWTVGILTLLTAANMFIGPFPLWMDGAMVVLPLVGGVIANRLVAERLADETWDGDDEAAA